MFGVLAVAVAAATFIGTAGPADAALPNSDWTLVTPANDYLPVSGPESCVHGTQFCMVMTGDLADVTNGQYDDADLVTTNAGKTWTPYNNLQPALTGASQLSCASVKVCWALYGADLAETTDGGVTWVNKTPAAWAGKQNAYLLSSLDCISTATCWVSGTYPKPGNVNDPYLATVTNGRLMVFSNLPSLGHGGTYGLTGVSCVSALSCVAVGIGGTTTAEPVVLTTYNGGLTWRLSVPSGILPLYSVSCVPATGDGLASAPALTCYAGGGTASLASPSTDSATVAVTHDGGLSWNTVENAPNVGWHVGSISCASASNCWATASGFTSTSLLGTADGGASWSTVTSDYQVGEYSSEVSCPSLTTCVATTAARIAVTADDGGLAG
jgi:hypothetical protein